MKKFVASVSLVIIFVFIGLNYGYILRNKVSTYKQENIKYISKVDSKNFYIYKYGKWGKKFINGVNIGATKPGYFPGEMAISKEEYLRWFKYIGQMNADAIRVYTILKPEFYEALYEYNKKSLKPIYIFQGVWVNEEDMANLMNANNPKIKENFKKDIKDLTDIIHGDAYLPPKKGVASGTYTKDISPYIMGWILGIEWVPQFVISTNELK